MRSEKIVRPAAGRLRIEPNITPLIDVLLGRCSSSFMAALPLTQRGLDLSVPEQTRGHSRTVAEHRAASTRCDRRLTVNTEPVNVQELQTRLTDLFRARRDKTLYIAAAGGCGTGRS